MSDQEKEEKVKRCFKTLVTVRKMLKKRYAYFVLFQP